MTMARKASVLTEKQGKYIDGVLDGKTKIQSARDAGYSENSLNALDKSRNVSAELAGKREELSDAAQIKRADVLAMLGEAFAMAKTMAEPSSMVSAAKEIGRMLGFYEPETIKVQLTQSEATMQAKFLSMTREELLQVAAGKAKVIEGEFKRVQ